ncbi:MAG: tRNA guanosine(15) transglycosylase TgtA [Candidatus Lokiarchaeota archaeon]|nr:tRNA guanosine(15) transglycosylase TgtA [Candidatus Lokiarchaeota archaeon]MBD3198712.1 tRNA guanosine(15) transglycosylase TgtA [Candidatus Lokiarchaeota archaeon]
MYEIIETDGLARIGRLKVGKKEISTPNLFPVVHPYDDLITAKEIERIGFKSIFTNAYILYQNEKARFKAIKKGIHDYLEFDGLIATDSGAFQQYMYKNEEFNITADKIERFQEVIRSDFPVILDIPVQPEDTYNIAKTKIENNLKRAQSNIKRRKILKNCWFGPIHGGKYEDLLKKSTIEMNRLKFGVYALGGLVKPLINYRFDLIIKILSLVKQNIKPNKPIHLFGMGLPQFFSLAIAFGCDLMDSAAYILYAKENRYFDITTGTKDISELKEFPCSCPICQKYTPNELRTFEDNFKINLIAKHNLYISFTELNTIKQAIELGDLWELVEQRIRSHPTLAKAYSLLSNKSKFIEKYEKVYKNHGRLFSSLESTYRPVFFRYSNRINKRYRIHKEINCLIFLPELDVKGKFSPSINQWLNKIKKINKINQKSLQILFYSEYFGVIPLELKDLYPIGQYEAIRNRYNSKLLFHKFYKNIKEFLKKRTKNLEKILVLIPKTYINQYNEEVKFSNEIINKTFKCLLSEDEYDIQIFNNFQGLIENLT